MRCALAALAVLASVPGCVRQGFATLADGAPVPGDWEAAERADAPGPSRDRGADGAPLFADGRGDAAAVDASPQQDRAAEDAASGPADQLSAPDVVAADGAGAPDGPAGWPNVQAVAVGYGGAALSDVNVRLEINTQRLIAAGELRADCGDMRFARGSNQLSYWLQADCGSQLTVVWVRLPLLDATTVIHFNHGNPAATSASDGDATFDFFDDFSGTSLDATKWHDWNPDAYGDVAVSQGVLTITATAHTAAALQARGIIGNAPLTFAEHAVELSNRWTFEDMANNGDNVQKELQLTVEAVPAGAETGDQYEWDFQWYRGLFGIHTGSYRFVLITDGGFSEPAKKVASTPRPTAFQIERYEWYPGHQVASQSKDGGHSFAQVWAAQSTFWTLPASRHLGISLENKSDRQHLVEVDWIRFRKRTPGVPIVAFP